MIGHIGTVKHGERDKVTSFRGRHKERSPSVDAGLDRPRQGEITVANGYFKLLKSMGQQPYRFNLHAPNHEIILRSENYAAKAGALNGIASVRENAPIDTRYERKESRDGQHYFNLTARNGQVIGTSERYTTERSRDNGIEAVKRYGPSAELKDET